MKLTELTLKEIIAQTASDEPVPGGGSVSALVGAFSAALTQMVARLTLGRKKYADVEPEMKDVIAGVEDLGHSLLAQVDTDAEAYNTVMEAYRLPKETDAEKAKRKEAIQEALKIAAASPLAIATTAAELLPFIELVATKGNANAVTDAGVAMLCCRTAVYGALLNVRVNLASIEDEDFVGKTLVDCANLKETVDRYEKKILTHVNNSI